MPETTQELPPELTFHFIKSNAYRVIHSDGAWGGISPHGFLTISFFSERSPVPQTAIRSLSDDGETYGEEKIGVRKENLVREIECTVMMDERAARSLKQWLDDKIMIFDQIKAASE
jgi:hypothetical protein